MTNTTNESMRRGLVWLGSGALVGRLFDLASLVFVLWFVTDRALGEASLAWSFSTILEAVSGTGCGIATSVLQAKDLSRRQLNAAFWFALAVAGGTAGLLLVASPLVAHLYAAPRIATFLCVYAIRHVAVGAASVPLQRLNHELRYRDVAAVQTLATALAAIVRTLLAVYCGGAWALVIGHVTQACTLAVAVFALSGFRPTRGYSFADVQPLLPFGLRMVGSDLVFQVFRNVDYLLVGYWLGLGPLGVYRVAFDVAMEVAVPIADLVSRSMTPQLARFSRRSRELHDAFLYGVQTLAALMSPVLVALFAIVPDVLALFGGGRFAAAAATARALVVAAGLRVVYQLFRPLLLATGRAGAVLKLELTALTLLSVLLALSLAWLGQTWGTLSAALAWIAVYPCLLLVVLRMIRGLEELAPSRVLDALRSGGAALPMFACSATITSLIVPSSLGSVARVAALSASVVATQLWLKRGAVLKACRVTP